MITCDVLIIGSGAGGLSCAVTAAHLGLDVVVIEKEPVFGGTTAWSGGWMRLPRNHLSNITEDKDPEFGRGTNYYNIVQGDEGLNNAPLVTAPFYAAKIVMGSFQGLKCDENAKVLGVAGLYAVGNDMSSMMGGATSLGPALTFGYIAAKQIAKI